MRKVQIKLSMGYFAIIDEDDFELASKHTWYASVRRKADGSIRTVYAVTRGSKLRLHRLIMNASKGFEVDHIDGDGLNCSKSNMRLATTSENQRNQRIGCNNKSGVKGVTWDKERGKWRVSIKINRKSIRIGRFENLEDAAKAYADASLKYHGDFGRLR